MDIFFFLYYLFFGLPHGVLEVPQVAESKQNRSWNGILLFMPH